MKPDQLSIVANGQVESIAFGATLGKFLEERGLKPTQVVVELNGAVLQRETVSSTPLREGDRLEIIVPVAGG